MKALLPIVLALMATAHPALAHTIYVDAANTSGIEDGTDEHPFNTIREGIASASVGDTVMARAGIYYPDESWNDHHNLLLMKAGVTLRGEGRDATILEGKVVDTQQSNLPIVVEDLAFDEFHFWRGPQEGPFDQQNIVRRCGGGVIGIGHAGGVGEEDPPPVHRVLIEDNDLGTEGIIQFGQGSGTANDTVRNNVCGYILILSGYGYTYLVDNNDVQYGIKDASGASITTTICNNMIHNGPIIDQSGSKEYEDQIWENNIINCNENAPLLIAEGITSAVYAYAGSATLRNNIITCTGNVSGIRASSGAPFHVIDNTITVDEVMMPSSDPEEGIVGLWNYSGWGFVTGNTISGGDAGYYSAAGTAEFANNTVTRSCTGFYSCGAEEVHHNTITECSGDGMVLHGLRGPIHHNTIRDNGGAGIRVEFPRIDLGGGEFDCPGNNIIMGNGNYDLLIEAISGQYPVLFAKYNIWDHADSAEIATYDIYDGSDAEGLLLVDFMPFDILGIGDLPLPGDVLQLFPIPATTTLRLQPPAGLRMPAMMELFNLDGARVARETIPPFADTVTLEVGHLPSGVYICRLQDDNHTWPKRVVIAQ
ncbi:DUF1565 domain-containing protein [Candidatus Fermentibacteria bacterium]|nr:DUF1565 domain-containing protein [Candidatus Fermentibacteria bacterium]